MLGSPAGAFVESLGQQRLCSFTDKYSIEYSETGAQSIPGSNEGGFGDPHPDGARFGIIEISTNDASGPYTVYTSPIEFLDWFDNYYTPYQSSVIPGIWIRSYPHYWVAAGKYTGILDYDGGVFSDEAGASQMQPLHDVVAQDGTVLTIMDYGSGPPGSLPSGINSITQTGMGTYPANLNFVIQFDTRLLLGGIKRWRPRITFQWFPENISPITRNWGTYGW